VINLYYEGASGNAKIKRILETYRANPPKAFGDVAVTKFQDFGRETIYDADGELIPSQDLYFVTLATAILVRRARQRHGAEDEVLPLREREGRGAAELPAVKAQCGPRSPA
jgi:phosphoglucomutase